MKPEPLILFSYKSSKLNRKWLREFAERLSKEVAWGKRFTVLLTSDLQLRKLNGEFRGEDKPTDVLSFLMEGPGGWLGDIAISTPRAREQAAQYGHSVEQEIAILMLHGLLHLRGYDHETDGGRMRELELKWRRRLGLPAGLIERTRQR